MGMQSGIGASQVAVRPIYVVFSPGGVKVLRKLAAVGGAEPPSVVGRGRRILCVCPRVVGSRLLLFFDFGPGILERYRAVEHRTAGRAVGIGAEIAQSFELYPRAYG